MKTDPTLNGSGRPLMSKKIKVLVVDDSAIAREMLVRGLSRKPDIEIIAQAGDAYEARDHIVLSAPDVMTLDVEMPRMDGIEFLKRLLPQYPIPVVVVSALTAEGSKKALEAMQAGAMGVVAKPRGRTPGDLERMIEELAEQIREASIADIGKQTKREEFPKSTSPLRSPPPGKSGTSGSKDNRDRMIAIGASTGGTVILNHLVSRFPQDMPGTVIVQHMPPVFTRLFAESLNRESKVEVREAADGDEIRQGLVLVAPGDFQLKVVKKGKGWAVSIAPGDKVSGHRPSVDVLFSSVAEAAGPNAAGLILTGMGRDGADGLLAMRRSGARCFAQNEESAVVFGMPREAAENGAAERLLSPEEMVPALYSDFRKPASAPQRTRH